MAPSCISELVEDWLKKETHIVKNQADKETGGSQSDVQVNKPTRLSFSEKTFAIETLPVPCLSWPRGYKTFFMLNSTEHEILPWFNWWVSFAPEFQCCYFCESSCLFYLSFNFDFHVSKIMHL